MRSVVAGRCQPSCSRRRLVLIMITDNLLIVYFNIHCSKLAISDCKHNDKIKNIILLLPI